MSVQLRVMHGPGLLRRTYLLRAPEFHSDYPDSVWGYLNAQPPMENGTGTRREQLIQEWTRMGRLEPAGSSKAGVRIDLLASSISMKRSLTIDVLADREMMLSDVRARISLMA